MFYKYVGNHRIQINKTDKISTSGIIPYPLDKEEWTEID